MEPLDPKKKQALTRELKKVKSFEIQRLCKRIRALKGKKGNENQLKKNERKVTRLLQEVEFMKDASLESLAEKILSSEVSEFDISDSEGMDVEKRALWKLTNSKFIKNKLEEFRKENDKGDGGKMTGTVKERHGGKKDSEKNKTVARKRPAKDIEIPEEDDDADSGGDDDEDGDDDGMFLQSIQDNTGSMSEEDDDEDIAAKRIAQESTKKVKTKQKGMENTDFYQGNVSSDDEEVLSLSDESDNERPLVSSTFVSLKKDLKGKKKSSKDRKGKSDKKGKKNKNRMGQRERRKIAEQKYGVKASHKIAERKEKVEAKKKERRSQMGGRKPGAMGGGFKNNNRVKEDEKLHPSWEASKRKKMMENVAFQGQKIVFGEDD